VDESLSHVEEFNKLRILFMSDVTLDREMAGALSAVMRTLHLSAL